MSREFPCRLYRIESGDCLVVELDLGFDIIVRKSIRLIGVRVPKARGIHRSSGLHATEFVSSWFEENQDNGNWPYIAYITPHDEIWKAEIYALDITHSLNDHLIDLGWGDN